MCTWKNHKTSRKQSDEDFGFLLLGVKDNSKTIEETNTELKVDNWRLMSKLEEVSTEKTELQKQYDELYEKYIDLRTKHEILLGIRKEKEQ